MATNNHTIYYIKFSHWCLVSMSIRFLHGHTTPRQRANHLTATRPNISSSCTFICGLGSSVGIAIDYGLDGPGSNPGGNEIFRPSRPVLGPTQPPVKWVPGLSPGVKCSRSVLLTTHPLLVPRSWKSRAIPLPNLWATPGL